MIAFLIGLAIGFIGGALAFRNNAKKAEEILEDAQTTFEKDKAAARAMLDSIKNK